MRKPIIFAGLAAITALSLSSCSKNEVDNPDRQETFTHTVTIKAGAPVTRTEIVEGEDEATFKWSADDATRFTVKENDVTGTGVVLDLSEDKTTAVLTASFASETASSYTYSAFLAGNIYGGIPGITNKQTMADGSYDPDADILVAKSSPFDEPQSELSLRFYRPVVINKMTLKGLAAGETVGTVVIEGDKKITGNYNYEEDSWTEYANKITVTVNQDVPENGELPIYFITKPVDGVTLTVTATTDVNTYSKTFSKTIDLKEGQVTVFGVNSFDKYTTFTVGNNTDDTIFEIASIFPSVKNGIKFVYDKGTSSTAPTFYSPFRWYKGSKVNISAGTTNITKIEFTYAGGNYTGGASDTSTGVIADAGNYTIEGTTGIWTGEATSVTFTAADGAARFSEIKVYTEEPGTETVVTSTPQLTFDKTAEIPLDKTKSLTATSDFNNATITYESDNTDVATVDNSGEVTAIAQGSVKITASIDEVNTDYYIIEAVSAECEVTVTAPADYDIINVDFTGVTAGNYTSWDNKKGSYSDAVYSGNTAKNSETSGIQLRSSGNSGIVSSKSGGVFKKVKVAFSGKSGKSIKIYGTNRPYNIADLYDDTFPQTLIGTISPSATEINVSDNYEYIGIIADGGAAYLDEIDIWWDELPERVAAPTNVEATVSGTTITVTWTDANAGSYIVTCSGQEPVTVAQGVQTASFSNLPNDTYVIGVQAVPESGSSYACSTISTVNATVTGAVTEVWKQTALEDITAGDVFVIVGKSGNNYYSMSNNNGTSSSPTASAVTVVSGTDGTTLSGNVADNVKWNLSATTADGVTSYTFYPNGSTTTWLYCNTTANSGSNTNIRVGTGARKAFKVDSNEKLLTNDTYVARYISLYSASDWRGYVAEGSGTVLYFFVLQDN